MWPPIVLSKEEVFTIRPSFVLPYMTGYTNDVEKALYLRQWAVPPYALAYIFGRDESYWYRLENRLGRNSIVGTTVKDRQKLPKALLADEKHTRFNGDKAYVATTVGQDCVLGASISRTADEAGLTEAYGHFKTESLNLSPDYSPETVNTDGWRSTHLAWLALFPSITVILCFLHAFIWRTLTHGRVLAILHNPAYAGTYVFGRTKTHPQLLPGETARIKGHIRPVKPEEWPIVLHDTHPGYISWDQFLRNQQRLDDNRTFRYEERRGAVREGAALLQGIALCGCCGRRMTIRYLDNGLIPSYDCNQLHKQLAGKTCQSLRGDGIDAAVAEIFLAAMQPAQLEVSLAALAQLEARAQQIDRQWQLRLERANYEADLARRRFMAVDPDNRLVARSLERDWNTKLAEVERLEREYTTLPQPAAQLVSPIERQRILALAQDLPTLWDAATTTAAERQQLLRFLIKDVTLTRQEMTIHIGIRWQTEAVSELEIARPGQATSPAVVDRIRELALTHTDLQVATLLNQEGYRTGKKRPFTANSVEWVRHKHRIALGPSARPDSYPNGQREDGRYTARAAAELLNVDVSTIADWCQSGRLEAIQTRPHCPRWIKLTPEIIAELRKPTRQHRSRRTAE